MTNMLRELMKAAMTEENKAPESFVNLVYDNNGVIIGSHVYSYRDGIVARFGESE